VATISTRPFDPSVAQRLIAHGVHPVLARIYAARGVAEPKQLDTALKGLLPLTPFKNLADAARILADAMQARKRLLIVADYDCDGATACAVAVRGLRAMGAVVDYLVPNRFEYGYGLTPEIVRLAAERKPEILITVDNGIASVEGVAEANRLGMQTLITDHHLPGARLPDALCIVNPNVVDCGFPSKHLAGVGVMFYVLMALRAQLRERGWFDARPQPNLANLLDIVALGTVADVVRLDDNNRILVDQGLKRIRAGQACAGINALYRLAGRDFRRASTYDLGFVLGPRLNAAGRLADMSLGIQCLLGDDAGAAFDMAGKLDALNRERRDIESEMQESALAIVEQVRADDAFSLCLFDPAWHQGVVGLLASRLKDKFNRPVIAFAQGNDGELKGSGRAIAGLHLRDALDVIDKQHPGMIAKFGGHAAAAGVTIAAPDFEHFALAFEAVARASLSEADMNKVIATDGRLAAGELTLDLAHRLAEHVWGQGFAEPLFCDSFEVKNQRLIGERHSKLTLCCADRHFEAMVFSHIEPLPASIRAAYRLQVNDYQGIESLQLTLEHWETDEA
jgi:single-stranded-DNA-specific exonuclease